MNIKGIVLAALIGAWGVHADVVVAYDFTGGDGAPTSVIPGFSASNIGRVGGWNISASSGNLYIVNPSTVPTGAADLAQYVSFAVNPLGNTVNYGSVSVRLGGDNRTSTIDYTVTVELRSSVDNYTSVLGTDSYTVLAGVENNNFKPTVSVLDVSGNSALQGIDTTTTFRLYVFDNSDYDGTKITVRLDDISATDTEGSELTGYDAWLGLFPGLGGSTNLTDDFEPDGMNNLLEYALGGNPTSDDASSKMPTSSFSTEGGTNWMNYVYSRNVDAAELTYSVNSTLDLVTGPITNATEEVGASVAVDGFQTVTNRVSIDARVQQFMRLNVQYTN